jgi:5-methylcytosine-specific restriction protein A
MVMRRDDGICYLCGQPGADAVDHVNQSLQDDNRLSNLKAVHEQVEPYCHRYKTAQEGLRAKQMNKPMKNLPRLHPEF